MATSVIELLCPLTVRVANVVNMAMNKVRVQADPVCPRPGYQM